MSLNPILALDEVHTYLGVLGSNIAFLLRRLHAHLARARHERSPDVPAAQQAARHPTLLNVGTSATIKTPADPGLSAERNKGLVPLSLVACPGAQRRGKVRRHV